MGYITRLSHTQCSLFALRSIMTGSLLVTELALGIIKKYTIFLSALHSMTRVISIAHSIEEKYYYQITCDVISVSSLFFFSSGWIIALLVDTVSLGVFSYLHPINNPPRAQDRMIQKSSQQSDFSLNVEKKPLLLTRERALAILNINEDQAKDPTLVEQHYEKIVADLESRAAKVPPVFANQIKLIIGDCRAAYQQLVNEAHFRREK